VCSSDLRKVLFVFGGSQGAMAINKVMSECAARLVREEGAVVLWQTGKPDYENMKKSVEGLENVKVFPFIENIYDFYRAADLAVCRAGAMTISELAKFGVPAVFVPLPTAAEGHQKMNALAVERQGAGLCVDQSAAEEKLHGTLVDLLRDEDRLSTMRSRMKELYREDSARLIADSLERELVA
jgi:UDP-N-acetylglucosamine--N-acetylmuramyl-(pentapeptide) pyrophosphoryl-undecaprenol N-acetylglucosamine transferase